MDQIDLIIPFKNKTIYRKRNLEFIIEHYYKYVKNLNIYVIEQDTNTDLSKFKYVNHITFKFDNGFSRSKCLNIGVKNSNSKYLILADNDLYLTRQFLQSVYTKFNDNSLIIPYNKPVIIFNNKQTEQLIKLKKLPINGIPLKFLSYGGIQLISRNLYYKIGGYDEQFVGWGHEDDAFLYKANKLIGVEYLENTIYHLYHEYGIPTLTTNERITLLNKLKEMTDVELLKYIENNIKYNL